MILVCKFFRDFFYKIFLSSRKRYQFFISFDFLKYNSFFFACFYFSNGNNHAVLVVGYGPGYFLVKNSWGSRWGEDGFFKIKSGVGLCGFGWQLNSVPLC